MKTQKLLFLTLTLLLAWVSLLMSCVDKPGEEEPVKPEPAEPEFAYDFPEIMDFGKTMTTWATNHKNNGGWDFKVEYDTDISWLSVTPESGGLMVNGPEKTFTVVVNRTGLKEGVYTGWMKWYWRVVDNNPDFTYSGYEYWYLDVEVRIEVYVPKDTLVDEDGDGLIDISTINDLNEVRYNLTATGVDSQEGAFTGYELMNDLDFNNEAHYSNINFKNQATSGEGWIPIGSSGNNKAINTLFDGNGHVIKNLYLNRPSSDYQGLFGIIGEAGVIQNLTLEINQFTAGKYSGGLIGEIYRGEVINCHIKGSLTATQDIGLLVGYNQGGVISFCSAIGTVTSSSYTAGGLVGANYSYSSNDGTSIVKNCWADVTVRGGENCGGLVGYNASDDEIKYCYANGNVVSTTSQGGGLVGENGGIITACYARGNVSSSSNELGGLVGRNGGTIVTSYSVGKVNGSGTSYNGGLIGYNSGKATATSYWDVTTSGLATSGSNATGLTTIQLQSPTSATGIYITWDEDAWDFGTSTQYPALKNMPGGLETQGR